MEAIVTSVDVVGDENKTICVEVEYMEGKENAHKERFVYPLVGFDWATNIEDVVRGRFKLVSDSYNLIDILKAKVGEVIKE